MPLDDGAEAQTLAQGLTEELTTAAAAIPEARVAARTSVNALHHTTKDMREIGLRLGLDALIEGSVRRAGNRVRLTVRLVDASDGCQLWRERSHRAADQGFEGQDAMARAVIEGMRTELERIVRLR